MQKSIFNYWIVAALMFSAAFTSCKEDEPVKAVSVGMQDGVLTAGKEGTVTFEVTTEHIADGSYTADVASLPAGVSVQGEVIISGNSGTLALSGNTSTTAETASTLTLTIDGTTSKAFTLTIGDAPVKTVSVEPQSREREFTAGRITFTVTTENIADGEEGTVDWFDTPVGTTTVSRPAHITATVSNVVSNRATVTIEATPDAAEGDYYFRVTIDGAVSNVATLTIDDDPMMDVLVCMYESSNRMFSIVAMKPDGTDKKLLFHNESINPKHGFIGSDGKTLLFSTEDNKGVYQYDIAGKLATKITDDGDFEVPVFSGDMKKVYVINANDPHNKKFISITIDTKVIELIADMTSLAYFSFTADGRIVFSERVGNIQIMNANGSNIVPLKLGNSSFFYSLPLTIPSRNQVVYLERNSNGNFSIRVIHLDSTGDAVLAGPAEGLTVPSANASGTKIAYFQITGGNSSNRIGNIIVGHFNGATLDNPVTVFNHEVENIRIWRPQFSRIDKKVYSGLADFQPQI